MAKKKYDNPFKDLQNASIGLGGLAITSGVTGGIVSKSPVPMPGISTSISTLASFAPIASVGIGGRSVLKVLKKKKKGGY